MLLDEAKATDLAVTDDDVRRAEQEAAEAEELAAELERQAIEDGTASPAQVVEQREIGRFARARINLTRDRAERAAAARRLLALAELGADVDKLAASAQARPSPLEQAMQDLAAAAQAVRDLCQAHDTQLQALVDRARQLGAEEAAPSGPRGTSAHVAVTGHGIAYRRTEVRRVGEAAQAAITAVTGGSEAPCRASDVATAMQALTAVREQEAVPRPAHLFARGDGVVFYGTPAQHADALAKGQLRELTPAEIDAYLEGTFT